jgi:hypothetical protein
MIHSPSLPLPLNGVMSAVMLRRKEAAAAQHSYLPRVSHCYHSNTPPPPTSHHHCIIVHLQPCCRTSPGTKSGVCGIWWWSKLTLETFGVRSTHLDLSCRSSPNILGVPAPPLVHMSSSRPPARGWDSKRLANARRQEGERRRITTLVEMRKCAKSLSVIPQQQQQ